MIKRQRLILVICVICSVIFLAWGQNQLKGKANAEGKMISLPKPEYRGMLLEEAIKKRRSIRNYSSKTMTQKELSQLLFAAQGITGKGHGRLLRAAPSAGAAYPFEIYLVVNNVEDLPRGIYHYSVLNHTLKQIKSGDFRDRIINVGRGQQMLGRSQVTFVLSAVFDRITNKYGERGLRYIDMEAGHISQNIYLQAVSLGLGSVSVGAFSEEEVNRLIGLDGREESVIYLHAVGSL